MTKREIARRCSFWPSTAAHRAFSGSRKKRDIVIPPAIVRLKVATGCATSAGLARWLDVSATLISRAVHDGHTPDVWLYKVAYATGRRVEWLRNGAAPEFVQPTDGRILPQMSSGSESTRRERL